MLQYSIIGLGEQSHGSLTHTLDRAEMLIAALRKRSIVICIEDRPVGGERINAYLHNTHPFAPPMIGTWNRAELLYLFSHLRDEMQSTGNDCIVVGVDPRMHLDYPQYKIDLIEKGIDPEGLSNDGGLSAKWKARLWSQTKAFMAAEHQVEYPGMMKQEDPWRMRDRFLAMNVLEVAKTYKYQCFFFAHNFHVAKFLRKDGHETTGYIINEAIGEKYLAVGYVCERGWWMCEYNKRPPDQESPADAPKSMQDCRLTVHCIEKVPSIAYAGAYEVYALNEPIGKDIWNAGLGCDWRSDPREEHIIPDKSFDYIYVSPVSIPSTFIDEALPSFPGMLLHGSQRRIDDKHLRPVPSTLVGGESVVYATSELFVALVAGTAWAYNEFMLWGYESKDTTRPVIREKTTGIIQKLDTPCWLYVLSPDGFEKDKRLGLKGGEVIKHGPASIEMICWIPSVLTALKALGVFLVPYHRIQQYMSFPLDEIDAYEKRFTEGKHSFTTRSQAEYKKYSIGEEVASPVGELIIENITYLPDGYRSHPYREKLPKERIAELTGYEADWIELSSKSLGVPEKVLQEREKQRMTRIRRAEDVDVGPIASQYGVKLKYLTKKFCEDYDMRNKSSSSSGEIMLGIYDDKELQVLSFFHELGHCIDRRFIAIQSNVGDEFHAWTVAWRISREDYDIGWSDKAILWAMDQVRTYHKPESEQGPV